MSMMTPNEQTTEVIDHFVHQVADFITDPANVQIEITIVSLVCLFSFISYIISVVIRELRIPADEYIEFEYDNEDEE